MLEFIFILLAILLIFLNAFFVAAEFGMVKLRDTRVATIAQQNGLRGRILAKVHHELDAYLSACQLGITLTSLGLGWLGEPAVASLLLPFFKLLGIHSQETLKVFAFFTAFTLISFLHIVVGELLPKSLAIRKTETIALWTAIPLYGFYWSMYPAIKLLNTCANFLLNKTHIISHQNPNIYSTEEIKLILNASHAHGELTQSETKIIQRTLNFADLTVAAVMQPYEAMIMLDLQQPIDVSLKSIFEHRYSRYPVYETDKQTILGVIHVKDLLLDFYQHGQITHLHTQIRPILKVSHRLSTLELLRQFREGISPFALVYNNKNALVGFITLDNLLRILIGPIQDEFHYTPDAWTKNSDGSILFCGSFSLYTLEKALGYQLEQNRTEKKIHTFTGLVLARLGVLPKIGEHVSFHEFAFNIQKMHGARITEVIIYPNATKE
jgi:CBS domain containing-hemolysin-like protein